MLRIPSAFQAVGAVARIALAPAGVGCESCRGPGSAYVKVFEDIFKTKRTYKVEELHTAGLRKIDESSYTTCHNPENPNSDESTPFDFAKRKDEYTHEHEALKQRAG